MKRKRSIGITIFSTVIIIVSALFCFMYLGDLSGTFGRFGDDITDYFSIVFISATLLLTFAGIGSFFLKECARRVTIIGASLLVIHLLFIIGVTIVNCVETGFFAALLTLLWWLVMYVPDILAPFILYFFTRPAVKAQFKKEA
ncbi:hypothetical protein ACFL38_03340 [Candidatus Omnitrophota bacterium]